MRNLTKTTAFLSTLMAVSVVQTKAAPAQTAPAATTAAPAAAPKPATVGLAVYPAKSQDAALQSKDEGECYAWAKQQTGIDPTATTAPAAVEAPKGGAVKGAARGAVKGAAVGAVGEDDKVRDDGNLDASEGAGAGAAVGAVKGRRAQKRAGKQAEAKAVETAKATDTAAKGTFAKSWGACLEGRGYSVK